MRRLLTFLVLALGLAWPVMGEPRFASISATATAATTTLLHNNSVKVVTLYNAGSKTVYFRLFTDADVERPAEASATPSAILPSGATLIYTLRGDDSESFVGTTKARYYKSISTICGGSDSTTVYVYYK